MSLKVKIEHRGRYYLIPFNKPYLTGKERLFLGKVLKSLRFSGDGLFGKKCQDLLKKELKAKAVFLTNSGTAALEMAALMANLKPGDEVIMPSFTFTSTANAFVLRGAKVVFEQKVTKGGELIFSKKFFSTYKPWANVYLKGTGPTQ